MKHVFSRFNFGAFLYLVMVAVAMLVFQNCSEPLELSEEDASTFGDGLPFAYDVKMDTFSYMSCYNMTATNYDRRAIYNFRIGAYEKTSGLKLTDEFKKATETFKAEAKTDALLRSPTNTGAILQLAARNTEQNYQQIWLNDGAVVTIGEDIENFLGGAPLSAPGIASALTSLGEGERVQYFKGTPGLDGRLLEASLRYHQNLKGVTDQFQTGLNLAITYTPENNTLTYFARSPDPNDQQKNVYGYKFIPDFRGVRRKFGATNEGGFRGTWQPSGHVIENRTVVGLREVNVQTNASHEWHCPGDLRLVLIEPFNSDPTTCTRTADTATYDDPSGLSVRDQKRLEVIRRVLRVEDYYVNLAENCVIPKDSKNSCYPKTDETANIAVDIEYAKGTGSSFNCEDNPGAGTYGCPNYVSICTRDPLPN